MKDHQNSNTELNSNQHFDMNKIAKNLLDLLFKDFEPPSQFLPEVFLILIDLVLFMFQLSLINSFFIT